MKHENISNFIVIESQILFDMRLSNTEKILYSYISALTNNKSSSCFATTDYLSKTAGIKSRQLKYCLQKLIKLNYITIEIKNGNKRIIRTVLSKFIEDRSEEAKHTELFDYNWLGEE